MSEDARFEDAGEQPLRLIAQDTADLDVIATLAQDAVFQVAEISWEPAKRRFALLLNRFRWEDSEDARAARRTYERVRSLLVFMDVTRVASSGFDRQHRDLVMSLLDIKFTPANDGTGQFLLTLAGDGAIGLEVECINAQLVDVTRPYAAPSHAAPDHRLED